jgi:nitrate reductase NapAB chaperone NapD
MPIKSYLVHPVNGRKEELLAALKNFSECEVVAASNQDVIALVTDTQNQEEDEALKQKLEAINSLELLSLVSGFNTPQN